MNGSGLIQREIITYLREQGAIEYCDLVDHAADHQPEWFDFLMGGSSASIRIYMKSQENKLSCEGEVRDLEKAIEFLDAVRSQAEAMEFHEEARE
jgi:hypothetical protein